MYAQGMRKILAGLLLMAACSEPNSYPGTDAAVPYSLTWTCQAACSPKPDIVGTTTLAVSGLTLTYGGGPGGVVHVATGLDAGGCLSVPAAAPGAPGEDGRMAYQLCPVSNGYNAVVRWNVATGLRWRVQAWR